MNRQEETREEWNLRQEENTRAARARGIAEIQEAFEAGAVAQPCFQTRTLPFNGKRFDYPERTTAEEALKDADDALMHALRSRQSATVEVWKLPQTGPGMFSTWEVFARVELAASPRKGMLK